METNKIFKFKPLILIFLFISNFTCLKINSQKRIIITNKNDVISLKNDNYIGLTTLKDTIKYFDLKKLSYKLFEIEKDSLILRKPSIYRDSIVNCNNNYEQLQKLKFDFIYVDNFNENESTFCKITIIEKYEFKKILNSEITSVQFPPKVDEPGNSCLFCILIPIYNIYFITKNKKHWKPINYKMEKWKLKIE